MTIKYILSKKKSIEGKNEILIRLCISRNMLFRLHSLIYIEERYWDAVKQAVKIPKVRTDNRELLLATQKTINSLQQHLVDEVEGASETIDKEWLQSLIDAFVQQERMVAVVRANKKKVSNSTKDSFFPLFDYFVSNCLKPGMRQNQFKVVGRALQRYEIYRGSGFAWNLNKTKDSDLADFEHFLSIEHTFFVDKKCVDKRYDLAYRTVPASRIPKKRGGNAIFAIMKKFRTFYNWVFKTKRASSNPFTTYKLKQPVYGTPFFLTLSELEKVYKYDFGENTSLATQRDIFIFQSCIGARVGDFFEMTRANIVDDGNALEYIPSKTITKHADVVRVLLTEQAKEILERYKDHPACGGKLLPFISQQKYNIAIKKVLSTVGIIRNVTILNPTTRQYEQRRICDIAGSHMCRRNFIGNLYNKVKDPNLIASMTGHVEGSKAFARYRTINDNVKQDLIDMLSFKRAD